MDHGILMNESSYMLLENSSSIALGSPLIIESIEKSLPPADSPSGGYLMSAASPNVSKSQKGTINFPNNSVETTSASSAHLGREENTKAVTDPTTSTPIANGVQMSSPPRRKTEKQEFLMRKGRIDRCNGKLLSKKLEKFKKKNPKSLLPQLDDLSSVQLETLTSKLNPDELSLNVRNHFFPCNQSIPRSPVREENSGEVTDLSDLDEPMESLDTIRCKWVEQKVQFGSEDASIAELIENKTLILDTMLAAYNTMQSCEFEDKPHTDSCARSRGLLTLGEKRSVIHLNNSSLSGSQNVRCATTKDLEYYSCNNSLEKGLGSYFHLISHIPKALVRVRNDRTMWDLSDIIEEQDRNGVSRAKKIKEKRERRYDDYDFEEDDFEDDDQRRRYDLSAKRKRGRPPKESLMVNMREPLPAKVNRRHSLATSGRPSGVYDFEDLVSELYVLHKPMEMDYKEIWIPNWCVVRRKRRLLPKPCQYCERDVIAKLAEDHHCEEYDEKRRFFAKLTKEKERQVLPEIPLFDIETVNVDPIVCSNCPPYPRRNFLSV